MTHHLRVWKADEKWKRNAGWHWAWVCHCGMVYGSPTWADAIDRADQHLNAARASLEVSA